MRRLSEPGDLKATCRSIRPTRTSGPSSSTPCSRATAVPKRKFSRAFPPGATPAAIESQIGAARNAARARGDLLALADLVAAVAPPSSASLERQYQIALHEAGHAVVAFELGVEIEEVSIIGQGNVGGWVTTKPGDRLVSRQDVSISITIAMGGRAADMVLGDGAHAGAMADLAAASRMLENAICQWGLFGSLRWRKDVNGRDEAIEALIASELDARLEEAMAIIEHRHEKVEELAKLLITERVLSGNRVAALYNDRAEPGSREEPRPSFLSVVGRNDDVEL